MRPTPRAILLILIWCGIAVAGAFLPIALRIWLGFGLVIVVAMILEAIALSQKEPPDIERKTSAALSLGEWHDVTLRLRHASRLPLAVEVFDGVPTACEQEGLPQRFVIPADGWGELTYRLKPQRRGEIRFSPCHLATAGIFGLLRRQVCVGEPQTVRVYPNFRQVAKLAMLAVDNRTAFMGIHTQRRRGEGTEFFQLREYREGDLLRQVDWKAVSRRNQLISREYREEQNQQVLFLLDCGRRLHTRDGEISHFDHVLNAVLLMTYVALRNGDGVGVMTFSGTSDRWLPPIRGRAAMNSILNSVYDLETSTAPSDFSEAAAKLAVLQRRRALVVLITNLRDDDSAELPTALAPLQRRHLMLVASLREPVLNQALEQPIEGLDDALRVGATHHYLRQRRRAHELVRGRGLRLLDVEPARLPVTLVNRYLDIKRSGVL